MTCQRMGNLVHAYVDQELSLTEQLSFEQHLATCPQCEQLQREIQSLRAELQNSGLRFALPAEVRARVLKRLGTEMVGSGMLESGQVRLGQVEEGWARRRLFSVAMAIAASVLICALSISALWLSWSSQHSTADELVDAHIRSLQAHHLFDVASTDQHTVKPWFDGKIDFAPPVRDLAGQGFPLLGGRLDYFHGRAIAALVYGRGKHIINVFLWPQEGADEGITQSVRQGYQVLQWRASGMRHVAVSDLNATELGQFAKLLP